MPDLAAVLADDHDDLRVSSGTLNGNYHSITPNRDAKTQRRNNDQMLNQIGKPLVAPRTTSSPLPGRYQQQQQLNYLGQANKQGPNLARQQQQQQQVFAGTQTKDGLDLSARREDSLPPAACYWSPLGEFAAVSFETADLVIRDASGQPCYILTVQAFLKLQDGLHYFSLRNFRPHPLGAYKIEFAPTDDKHASQRLVLNCSPPNFNNGESGSGSGSSQATMMSASLVSQERAQRPFYEELTIQVDCGYLLLRLRGDGHVLLLDEIAFYQDDDIALLPVRDNNGKQKFVASAPAGTGTTGRGSKGVRPAAPSRSPSLPQSPTPATMRPGTPSMQWRHLVYSSAARSSPLIVMPIYSRYVCQDRIILAGNNTVELVLERFELKRLTNEPADYSLQTPPTTSAPFERDLFIDSRPRRQARATTIIYKSPINGGE